MTSQELKEILKTKRSLESLINSTRLKITLGRIKSTEEALKFLGLTIKDEHLIGKEQLPPKIDTKAFNLLANRILSNYILHAIDGYNVIASSKYEWPWEPATKDSYIESSPIIDRVGSEEPTIQMPRIVICDPEIVLDKETKHPAEEFLPSKPNPKQKCFLFNFQKLPALELFYGIVSDKLSAQLLRGGTGSGKTFVYCQVIRWLHDIDFFHDKSISPWPAIIITKASVVEKTRRDALNYFGLKHPTDIWVTNFDQLRSSFGKKTFIKHSVIVEDGIEHEHYTWVPGLHPCLFIIDECHAAKNIQSKQSRIIQSIAAIPSPHVYCIFSSATPWTRVVEAKAFILCSRMEYDPYKPLVK